MKIFITGGSGFIGTNFILNNCLNSDNKIINYDSITYAGSGNNLSSIDNNNYSFIKGDITNSSLLKHSIITFEPDIILHFAAESHVDRSIKAPNNFINTNILGTFNLLNALNYYKNELNNDFRFLHISTDEVYGSLGTNGNFDENSVYKPNSPYSASKASSDHLVRAWFKTYGIPAIIINCSNNYGPFQFPEKLIPLIITNCIDEKTLPVYGDGSNIRDWLYVEDHCSAINNILLDGTIGEKYNIGGNNEIKNIDIVNKICSILDKMKPRDNKLPYSDLIAFVEDRPGHDFRYAINSSKIQNELNWKPSETFETGIYKTIEWYIKNESWWRKIQKNNKNLEN